MLTLQKTGLQLFALLEEILQKNYLVGSDFILLSSATNNNKAAATISVDLLTNYVVSVLPVVLTMVLCVNGVFKRGTL